MTIVNATLDRGRHERTHDKQARVRTHKKQLPAQSWTPIQLIEIQQLGDNNCYPDCYYLLVLLFEAI